MAAGVENRSINVFINNRVNGRANIKEVEKEYFSLRNTVKKLDRNTAEYHREVKKIALLKGSLDSHRKSMSGLNNEVKNQTAELKNNNTAWKRIGNSIKGTLITYGLFLAGGAIGALVTENAKLDDSFAQVQKTTNLADSQIETLQKRLDGMNTRTSREELLKLAAVAGRSGIFELGDVTGFVRAADQIQVALGDELGDDAVRNIAKLDKIFGVSEIFGYEEGITKLGSAINELGQTTIANEGFILEFSSKIAGSAKVAGLSAEETFAFGAAADILGQKLEVSSTAIGQLLINIFSDTAEYAKVANVELGEFEKMLEEDAFGAMLKFLKGLGEVDGGMDEIVKKLGLVNVDGNRARQVFLALSQGTEILEQSLVTATKATAENTSIGKENVRLNTTLAAKVAILGKKLKETWVNSGVKKAIDGIIDSLFQYVQTDISEVVKEERLEFSLLSTELVNGNTPMKRRLELWAQLQSEYPEILKGIELETLGYDGLTASLKLVNSQINEKFRLAKVDGELEAAELKRAKLQNSLLNARTDGIRLLNEIQKEAFVGNNEELDAALEKAFQESVTFGAKVTEDDFEQVQIRIEATTDQILRAEENLRRIQEDRGLILTDINEKLQAGKEIIEDTINNDEIDYSNLPAGFEAYQAPETSNNDAAVLSEEEIKARGKARSKAIADAERELKKYNQALEEIGETLRQNELDRIAAFSETPRIDEIIETYLQLEIKAQGNADVIQQIEEDKDKAIDAFKLQNRKETLEKLKDLETASFEDKNGISAEQQITTVFNEIRETGEVKDPELDLQIREAELNARNDLEIRKREELQLRIDELINQGEFGDISREEQELLDAQVAWTTILRELGEFNEDYADIKQASINHLAGLEEKASKASLRRQREANDDKIDLAEDLKQAELALYGGLLQGFANLYEVANKNQEKDIVFQKLLTLGAIAINQAAAISTASAVYLKTSLTPADYLAKMAVVVPGILAIAASAIDLVNSAASPKAPTYKDGTSYHPGGWAIFNEKAALKQAKQERGEAVFLPRGAKVKTAGDTEKEWFSLDDIPARTSEAIDVGFMDSAVLNGIYEPPEDDRQDENTELYKMIYGSLEDIKRNTAQTSRGPSKAYVAANEYQAAIEHEKDLNDRRSISR